MKNTTLFLCVSDHKMKTISWKPYLILSNQDKNWWYNILYSISSQNFIQIWQLFLSFSPRKRFQCWFAKLWCEGISDWDFLSVLFEKIWLKKEKSKTLLEPFQWSIFWALCQRSKPSISWNQLFWNCINFQEFWQGIIKELAKIIENNFQFTQNLNWHQKTQSRHLKFQGYQTKSSIILVAMKLLANHFWWHTVRRKKEESGFNHCTILEKKSSAL